MANIKKTLLERVKEVKGRKIKSYFVDDETIEVVIAYLNDEVTSGQIEKILDWPKNSTRYRVCTIIKKAIVSGKVSVKPFIGEK